MLLYNKQKYEDADGEYDVDIWVSLSHDLCDTDFREEDAQHWSYTAHYLLNNPKPGQSPILAVMKGYYFVPYKGEKCGTHENFLRMVGNGSPELDQISDVISQLLPDLGYKGVFDFYKKRGDETGILVVYPVMHPDFREKGWIMPLLSLLMGTIADVPPSIVIDSVEEPLCFYRCRNVEGKNVESPWLGVPSIVLLPSSGSPGEENPTEEELMEFAGGFDHSVFVGYFEEGERQ